MFTINACRIYHRLRKLRPNYYSLRSNFCCTPAVSWIEWTWTICVFSPVTSHITHIQSRSCILFGGKDFLWSLAFHDEEKTCEEHRCVCTSLEPEDAVVVVVVVVLLLLLLLFVQVSLRSPNIYIRFCKWVPRPVTPELWPAIHTECVGRSDVSFLQVHSTTPFFLLPSDSKNVL